MIDIEIKRRFDPFSERYYYDAFYECTKTGKRYRRILGGLAWAGVNPGFAVVVGEDLGKDEALGVHHFRVLDEVEEARIEDLINRCDMLEIQARDISWTWYTTQSNKPAMEFVYAFWDEQRKKGRQAFSLANAPYVNDPNGFEFCVNVLKKHLVKDRKSLHLGERSNLPGYLMNLPSLDISKARPEDYPPIAALGYAVATLACWSTCGLPGKR
jgi:hypothetical protein